MCADLPVEALTERPWGKGVSPSSQGKLDLVHALLTELEPLVEDPAWWLQGLLVEGVPIRKVALVRSGPEAVIKLAEGKLSETKALTMIRPDWKEAYSYKPARTRKKAQASTA